MNFSAPIQKLSLLATSPKLQRPLRLVLSVVLLAVLMSILAQWTWLLIPTTPSSTPTASSQGVGQGASTSTTQPAAPSPLASISSARLWGALPVTAAPSVTQDTRLPLTLRGILSGEGLAIIETSGNTKVYRIGDTLPGGARLHDVLADHVLIDRAGVIERLALPRQLLGVQALGNAPIAPQDTTASSVKLGQLLQQSPAELSKEFRLSPVTEGGKLRGYRLRALRSPEMLQRAGLEADDVLISVNGTSLTQANDLPKFIKDLRSATTLDAVVLRNGSEVPLHLDLNAN